MSRFRLTLEPLDARALPSAVLALPDDPTAGAVQIADESDAPAPGDAGATGTAAGKVVIQDFHFVKKVDKASTTL